MKARIMIIVKILIIILILASIFCTVIFIPHMSKKNDNIVRGEVTIQYLDGSVITQEYCKMSINNNMTVSILFPNDPNLYTFYIGNVEIKEYR